MKPRINLNKAGPAFRKIRDGAVAIETAIRDSGLPTILLNLVRVRASQINGCAYCLDMHSKDLRAEGETEQRIYCLEAWREAPFYSDQERAALAWCEALTNIRDGHAPDDVYDEVRQHFSENELLYLTATIATINFWNRVAISLRAVPGEYQPPQHAHSEEMAAH